LKNVAYLGPPGSYSEQAAKDWEQEGDLIPADSIPAVAELVTQRKADQGVIPIENSIEGGVTFTLDLLIQSSELLICGELIVPIRHALMAKNEIPISEIRQVLSHPQSLGQCRQFLLNELPHATLVASLSNSKAVQEMMDSDLTTAAISSERAAVLYGAKVLKHRVEDVPNNETRFIVLSHSDHRRTGNDKTSICFEFGDDAPGILSESLMEFASRDINLAKIESRPNKKSLGRYVFLADIEGHRSDKHVSEALKALKKKVTMMKILGSYPSQMR
jgi:prephenate dehydratase